MKNTIFKTHAAVVILYILTLSVVDGFEHCYPMPITASLKRNGNASVNGLKMCYEIRGEGKL